MYDIEQLRLKLHGEIYNDIGHKYLYATDASVYQELPAAVVFPKNKADIAACVKWSLDYNIPLIPRAAGTSLAGQVVGNGLVLDCSRYMRRIVEINKEEGWVLVEPGVVRDELNRSLEPYGLFFGPNTSTSNRCTIGGMVGNNSSGTSSIKYGVTRDKLLETHTILSDGSEYVFNPLDKDGIDRTLLEKGVVADLLQFFTNLSDKIDVDSIIGEFAKPEIKRRNTGYALDAILKNYPFNPSSNEFDLNPLLAGSEGTLAISHLHKLKLDKIPVGEKGLLCLQFDSLNQSMEATVKIMRHDVEKCELLDHYIIDAARQNPLQAKNGFFIEGSPAAVLCVELIRANDDLLNGAMLEITNTLEQANLLSGFRMVEVGQIDQVWAFRNAGLGVLSNLPGDAKPVACVEDTAVAIQDLPNYVKDLQGIFGRFKQEAVFYAHAGAGELHIRPILNLKEERGRKDFEAITQEVASLVKSYNGSFSGEHGDGRVRAPFLNTMFSNEVIEIFEGIKKIMDPHSILNPHKILNPKPMLEDLRFEADQKYHKPWSVKYNYSAYGGMQGLVEKCNGSGDCRKSHNENGSMCPSYHVTHDEKHSTRGRANLLRNILLEQDYPDTLSEQDVFEGLELCLSCKACTSECPSGVNMTILKSEFLQHYYSSVKRPLKDLFFGYSFRMLKPFQKIAPLYNLIAGNRLVSGVIKSFAGIHSKRTLPKLSKSVKYEERLAKPDYPTIAILLDEFNSLYRAELLFKAGQLLNNLGYGICFFEGGDSGRAAMSKGLLNFAKRCALENIERAEKALSKADFIIGVEPSVVSAYQEEYSLLVDSDKVERAKNIAQKVRFLEDWLVEEVNKGRISADQFDNKKRRIIYHGHCHQKSSSGEENALQLLSLPNGHLVSSSNAGCCGMAGSFGYQKKHYDISQKIAGLKLKPTVETLDSQDYIVSSGFSCAHQINDLTPVAQQRHVIEILFESLQRPNKSS